MDKSKENKIKFLIPILIFIIGTIGMGKVQAVTNLKDLPYETTEMVFLSDIDYEKDMSYIENGNSFRFDLTASNRTLTLRYNDEIKRFDKGISAWATSNLVYDVSNYNYDKFTAYIGVDSTQTNDYFNDGASITIYTSNDGENWDEAYVVGTKKGVNNATYVDISITGVKYLRLYAYSNGKNWWSHWYDDVLYADARLTTNGYVEDTTPDNNIHTLEWYDDYLKKNDFSDENYEKYLLQRQLVSKVTYDSLQFMLKYNIRISKALKWMLNDPKALEYYVLGGDPTGSYVNSFGVLADLYEKYEDDMDITTKTERGVVLGDLYKRMLITLSLTHASPRGSWVSGIPSDPNHPNGSNAVNRYFIYKKLHKNGRLINEIFEDLTIEEMRMVMIQQLDDDQIEWLNYYSSTKKNGLDPYSYIAYDYSMTYDYSKEQYYSESMYDYWNNKYNLTGDAWEDVDWDLTFKPTYGYKKLYVVFEEGSVCGGIAKTGINLQCVWGVPSFLVGQPRHAAYVHMKLDDNGNKTWILGNDVSGWSKSETGRIALGWNVTATSTTTLSACYLPLVQLGIDDYDNYIKAEEYMMLAELYKNEGEIYKAEEYYNKAIETQKFNYKAWVGLVDIYVAEKRSDKELYDIAESASKIFKYYPLANYELLGYIEKKMTEQGDLFTLNSLRVACLQAAKNATEKDVLQPNIAKVEAQYLAGDVDERIVSFTFDGNWVGGRKTEDGSDPVGYILLSEDFKGNEIYWQYMINGKDWKDAKGIEHKLTDAELATVNEEMGIKVRITGAPDVVYTINITKASLPTIYANDLENRIYGFNNVSIQYWDDDKLSWEKATDLYFRDFDTNDPDTWWDPSPIYNGNQVVYFRTGATGTTTASDVMTLVFKEDNTDPTHSYIKKSRLSVDNKSASSYDDANPFNNVIDGNGRTYWKTEKTAKNPYFTIELDAPTYVSALQYIPPQSLISGLIIKAKIEVSEDGKNWTTAVSSVNWGENEGSSYVEFDKPYLAKYVKLTGLETSDGHMAAALINLFEDTTQKINPTATVEYSINTLTNQDVVATLIPDKYVEVTSENVKKDENGNYTYTFETNGDYTFKFKDIYGNEGSAEAKVNWIDKVIPEAEVVYSTTDKTKGSVIATLKNKSVNKNIIITNNDGSDTYVFDKNDTFTFEFEDEAGNKNTVEAKVDWIEENAPNIYLKYNTLAPTNQPVTAEIVCDTEFEITNNDKSKNHTFNENGEWTFAYKTSNDYTGSITARVTWIDKVAPVVNVEYSTSKPTNQPVIATLISNKEIIIDDTSEVYKDEETENYYHIFEDNGEFTFEYHDIAGNTGSIKAEVNCIDKTPPVGTIRYSKTTPTNQPVTATLICDKKITVLNNNGSNVALFDKNGSFEFIYRDEAGNENSTIATVDCIDLQAPVGTVEYSTTEPTIGPVVATLKCDEPITILNEDGKTTHTFYENGNYEFEFTDEAGNISTAYAVVNWIIDSDVRIQYSTLELTNQDVTATLVFDENRGITAEEREYVFETNGTHDFKYTDSLGNTQTVQAKVSWIDKEAPTAKVQYSTENPTNGNVTATIYDFSKQNITMIEPESGYTHEFTNNGDFIFKFRDEAGNEGSVTAKVDWIDREAPTAEVEYSTTSATIGTVTATLINIKDTEKDNNYVSSPENITIIKPEDGSKTHTFNQNGSFTFEFEDEAGNVGTATATVDWIVSESIAPTISYSIETLTNQDVTATLIYDENSGITVIGESTHVFTTNGTHPFIYKDSLGVEHTLIAEVTWIDKEAPTAKVQYSTEKPTFKNVTVTISFNKENVTITNNEGKNTYTFDKNGDFTFEFKDEAGNEGSETAMVTCIKDFTFESDGTPTVVDNEEDMDVVIESILEDKTLADIVKKENTIVTILTTKLAEEFEDFEQYANGRIISNYFDISIIVTDGSDTYPLNTLKENITLKLKIPEDLPSVEDGKEREYYILREHDGGIKELEATVIYKTDGENGESSEYLEFKSDKFSTYALVYKDVSSDESEDPKVDTLELTDAAAENNISIKGNYIILPASTTPKKGITFDMFKAVSKTSELPEYYTIIKTDTDSTVTLVEDTSKIIKTGDSIKVGNKTWTFSVRGDVDGDGEITVNDLAKVKLHFIGKETLKGAYLEAAETDNDGIPATVNDISRFKLVLIEKISDLFSDFVSK